MNIHINKQTRLQPWHNQTIFGEYPLFIRPGNFTVSLLFHDAESISRVAEMLSKMLLEIQMKNLLPPPSDRFGKALS